jgi:uncharacterized protein YbbK (DUF523 family)
VCCRYDGRSCAVSRIEEWVKSGEAVPICPEVAGGLGVPRTPCEIRSANQRDRRVVSKDGRDCTDAFVRGAQEALRLVRRYNIARAVLKSRSPSCGFGRIYDGTFSGRLIDGSGVTAELLNQNGVEIFDENSLLQLEFT